MFNFTLITLHNYGVWFRIARHSNKTLFWHAETTHAVFFNDTPVTETISEHLLQFSFVPSILSILLPKNLGFTKEISQNLNKKDLYLTILIKIGLTYFKLINKMLIFLWIFFLNKMDSILDTHAPLKKVNKYKLKFKTKPWITTALQKSISFKNNLRKNL